LYKFALVERRIGEEHADNAENLLAFDTARIRLREWKAQKGELLKG
jgi:hypothetical protein